MTTAKLKYTAAMVGCLIIGGLSTAAISHFMAPAAQAESSPAERKVLYWYDPMKPDVRFEKPGKSPFMDMDLVAKYADEGGDTQSSGVRIDPTQVHNLGLRTAKVSKIASVTSSIPTWKDCAISLSRNTSTKKSKASSVQLEKLAMAALRCSGVQPNICYPYSRRRGHEL